MITADMHITDMLNEVQKLRGSSYNFMDMRIDGNDEVAALVKQAQAKEFSRVSKLRLVVQQQMYRQKQEREQIINEDIEIEFQDFKKDNFLAINLTEIELADAIIELKMQDIAIEEERKERCLSWVMNHAKC